MRGNKLFLATAMVLFVVLAATSGLAANEIISFKVDKNKYLPGESISLQGALYSDAGAVDSGNITFTLDGAMDTALTSADGSFTKTLTAPSSVGDYTLNISYGSAYAEFTLSVSFAANVELALLSTSSESYEAITFTSDMAAAGISDPGSVSGAKMYGNFTNSNQNYFAILQNNGEYDTLFISQAADFSTLLYQDMGKGSKLKLAGSDYKIFYIDPAGEKAFIMRELEPVFYGTGSEWAQLLILALNSTGSPLKNLTTMALGGISSLGQPEDITLSTLDDYGDPVNITNSTHYLSIRQGTTNGYKAQQLLISAAGGTHELIVGGLSHISYFVKTFSLNMGVESLSGSPISTAQTGQTIVLKASVVDLNTASSTSNATVAVKLIAPDGAEADLTLAASPANIFTANTTLSNELTGEYSALFTAEYAGATIKKQYRFNVKSNELFMKAFSPGKGEGEGFPPNAQGVLVVGGKDLSTSTLLNLTTLTDGCDSAKIYLKSIQDEKKTEYLAAFSVLTLSALLDQFDAPQWIREDMQDSFGEKACAIIFSTPSASGSYKLEVEANLSGTLTTVKDYLDVTTLFVFGMPAHCTTGAWSDRAAPGGTVCIRASVYDASTGRQIARANITELALVEVFSQTNGIITDQISDVAEVNFTNGEKGLSFKTSNTSLGDHSVRFKVKAINNNSETVRGTGFGWYRTELWSVWAYPYCANSMFCSSGSSSDITLRVEAYSAGFGSGQQDITVALSSIKNFDTGETISINTSGTTSCTTLSDNSSLTQNSSTSQAGGKVMPAYCYLTIVPPAGGWSSGGHELKLTATDTDSNNLSFYSGFKVESFRFFAWNKNWEITASQDLEFDVTLEQFDGQEIQGNVTVSKLYYMGSGGSGWVQPREIGFQADSQVIDGRGIYRIDSEALSTLKSGFYDLVLTANSDSGSQTARVGFNIRSFVAVANPVNNNWDRRYAIGDSLVINLSGFNSINWSTYPPTGEPHNISHVTAMKIIKMGMWDRPYKNSEELVPLSDDTDCVGTTSSCLFTIDLSGFEQSQYDLELQIEDNAGNTVNTNYNFMTETFTITVPEIQDFRIIPSSNRMTEKMELTLSTDKSCGTSSDTVDEPTGVTNCLFDEQKRLPTIYDSWDNRNLNTVFLLDKTNNSDIKLYVNTYNNTPMANGQPVHNNFTQAPALVEGNTFTDSNGYLWNITTIDSALGKLTLRSIDGVIKTRTKQAEGGSGSSEVSVEYLYQYIVNKSLSQSGFLLYAGSSSNDMEDKFWDEEWAQVDLDSDGKYNCGNFGEEEAWACEEYFILLADRQTSGVYDTLLLSATRDMTLGVNSYSGLTGTGDIRLNDSADPIYLLNLIYSETNGVGSYRLVTTTNKAGWPGRNLGIFQVDSEQIKVPVMIASPSSKSGLSGENVTIRKLRTFGKMNFEEYGLANPAVAITGDSGIAILVVNASGIPTGEYKLVIEVNRTTPGQENYITTSNDYDNPTLDLRSFSISSLLGLKKRLDGIVEWSAAANNLFAAQSSEASLGNMVLRLQCNSGGNELQDPLLCHVDDWRYRELWVNLSDNTVFKTTKPNNWYLETNNIGGDRWPLGTEVPVSNDFGGQMSYIVGQPNFTATQIAISEGEIQDVVISGMQCAFRITLNSVDPDTDTIGWTVSQVCPWSDSTWIVENGLHNINEPRFLWDSFNISSVGETNVVLNMLMSAITLSSPIQGIDDFEDPLDPRIRVVSNALSTDHSIYVYNSNQVQTRDDLENRSGMFDTFVVVNSTNAVVGSYIFGQPIEGLGDALDGKTIVQANPWEQTVYFSSLNFGGRYIYPLPWSCDDKKFYVGNYSEAALGFKLYDCMPGSSLSSTPNYIIFFDDVCDGVWSITRAKSDDDPVLDDSWAFDGSNWKAYDYTRWEEGEVNPCEGSQEGPQQNSSEKWIDLGRDSWPFSITDYTHLSSGYIDIFKTKWNVNNGEDITSISLWVQTKNFDGTTFNGTITLDKATGTTWQCGMMSEVAVNVPTSDGNLIDGLGYLDLDLGNLTSSQPSLKFKVQDAENAAKYEYVTKSFWYGPGESNMNFENQDCGDMFKGGPGGGSMGGGDMGGFDGKEDFDRCGSNVDNSTCQSSGCVWIPQSFFGPTAPPEDKCLPCMALDDKQEACESKSDTCVWIPAGAGGSMGSGVCDPLNGPGAGGGSGEPSCEGLTIPDTKEVLESCSCGGNFADVGEFCCEGGAVTQDGCGGPFDCSPILDMDECNNDLSEECIWDIGGDSCMNFCGGTGFCATVCTSLCPGDSCPMECDTCDSCGGPM